MSDWKEKVAAKKAEKTQTKLEAKASTASNTGVKVNTQGWRSSGNAYLFKLKLNETIVAYYTKKGGKKLASPQKCDKFDFEFHPMHTTGNPIYIRMDGSEDNSLITKFDTKNKPEAPKIEARGSGKKKTYDFHNLEKLTLNSTEMTELELLIKNNYDLLQYMAKCAYEEDGIC
jgi:hypothetical protein